MKTYYISGCNTALIVKSHTSVGAPTAGIGQGPGLAIFGDSLTPESCPTGLLLAASSPEAAKEVCRGCPKGELQPYFEQPPDPANSPPPPDVTTPSAAPELPESLPGKPPTPEQADTPAPGAEPEEAPPVLESSPPVPESSPPTPRPSGPLVLPALAVTSTTKETWGGSPAVESREVNPNAKPRLSELLPGIGGPTLMGTTAIRGAERCLRYCYWQKMRALEPPREPSREFKGKTYYNPLELGALVHSCIEYYLLGGFDVDLGNRPLEKVKPHYPGLAAEGARLYNRYINAFREEDMRTWDVRAVELESRYYFPPRKLAGKQRQLFLSARFDSVVRIIPDGGQRIPVGSPVPPEESKHLAVHDLKTISNVQGTVEGYRHELQVLQELLCARHGIYFSKHGTPGNFADDFGSPSCFMVSWVGKAQEFNPKKHVGRARYDVPEVLVEEFARWTGDFLYEELGPRMFSKDRDKLSTWPKRYGTCRDPITNRACPYLALCEAQERANPTFSFVAGTPFDPEATFVKPQKAAAKPAAKKKTSSRKRKADVK
jgi:hypothetical protein